MRAARRGIAFRRRRRYCFEGSEIEQSDRLLGKEISSRDGRSLLIPLVVVSAVVRSSGLVVRSAAFAPFVIYRAALRGRAKPRVAVDVVAIVERCRVRVVVVDPGLLT